MTILSPRGTSLFGTIALSTNISFSINFRSKKPIWLFLLTVKASIGGMMEIADNTSKAMAINPLCFGFMKLKITPAIVAKIPNRMT